MDSPDRNRLNTKLHESPSLFNLFSDLSPLKLVKASNPGFPLANLPIPSIFMSPQSQSFPRSMEMDPTDSKYSIQSDSGQEIEFVQSTQDEHILSPSEYLAADPPDAKSFVLCGIQENDIPNTGDRVNDSITKVENNIDSTQNVPKGAEIHNKTGQSSRMASRASFKEFYQRNSNVSRHLHFGSTMGYNETHESTNPGANPHVRITVPYHNELSRNTSSFQAGAPAQFAESFEPTQNYVHDSSICFPTRFGLPFSGTTRSLSKDSDFTAFKLVGNQNAQDETQGMNLDGASNSSATPRDFYARLADHLQENQASGTVGSANHPIIQMQSPSDSIYLTPYDYPYEVKMPASPNTDMDTVEELRKASPKSNKKRGKDLIDTEGCKNCNCKRSRCLKLYCECFAAGVYCLDTCACENCFNRPEYEDTVLDTRQKIEIRNPLAFAPKVVKATTSTPANMEESPSSARHKRGCNCKKSKCLKKYCECYQAGVGCYNGCRCEDCNNCFGRKTESIYRRTEKRESTSGDQMDLFGARCDFIETGNSHQFSSKWEEFPNISLTPLSRQSNVSHDGSSLWSSTANNRQDSSSGLTPQLLGRKVLSEINSNRIFYNMMEGDSIPSMSTPLKPVQARSPNRKRLSPPQFRAQNLSSSSSHGFKNVRKLTLPPSPLTPYNQFKSGEPRIDDDIKETT